MFWLDCVEGVDVEPKLLDDDVLAEPLNDPAPLALPVAFIEPELFCDDQGLAADGAVLVLALDELLGVVACMSFEVPNWLPEDVLVVGVVCEPLELKLEDVAFEPD